MGIVDRIMDAGVRKRIQGYIDNFPKRLSHDNATHQPEVAKMMEQLFKHDDIICLPQDNVIKIGVAIEKQPDLVLPSQAVEHVIRNASHRVLMNFCICREAMQCRDYPIELGCLFLGDAAKKIHPELGREATVDEALDHARRAREAGLVHAVGRSGIDPVWLNVGPPDRLLTICNCCPCCCIARTVPYSHPVLGEKYSRMPGVEVRVTEDCVGCGECEDACIFMALSMEDGRAVINPDICRGCGRCASLCPEEAIEVVVEDPAFLDKTIERLGRINYR
ncbi:MAG TPA: 4Fe-4S binding protein [bacterium]|nr:4Fe-4S binding protein [bacterium]